MLRFYWSLLLEIPSAFRSAVETWLFWGISVVVPLAVWLNPSWRPLMEADAFSRWFIAIPVAVSLLYGLLRANFRRFEANHAKIKKLEARLEELTRPRLHVVVDRTTIDAVNDNIAVYGLKVGSTSATTIPDVEVTIVEATVLGAASEETTRQLREYVGAPLMLNGDRDMPPKRAADIHPGQPRWFDVVMLQADTLQALLKNARRRAHHTGNARFPVFWNDDPGYTLPAGAYRVRLRVQGRDVPAVFLTLDIHNERGNQRVIHVA